MSGYFERIFEEADFLGEAGFLVLEDTARAADFVREELVREAEVFFWGVRAFMDAGSDHPERAGTIAAVQRMGQRE
jgi:hypothetical protein